MLDIDMMFGYMRYNNVYGYNDHKAIQSNN